MSFSRGFTLIEVLVTAFVLATVAIGLTGLGLLSTRSAIQSERQNVAQAIANEEVEVARTYSYPEVDYTDFPPGKIERVKTVTRNDQEYTVEAFIDYVDDPANGTLPAGMSLTKDTADFTKVLFRVSWKSTLTGGEEPTSSSTVVAATFFANQLHDACVPSTETCENPQLDCVPNQPAGCVDGNGDFTVDCPATGICPGSDTPPFVACPSSGKCADVPNDGGNAPPGTQEPNPDQNQGNQPCQSDSNCPSGSYCASGQCQPNWCRLLIAEPNPEECEGEVELSPCSATCPSWQKMGHRGEISTQCVIGTYCGITRYYWRQCPDNPDLCDPEKDLCEEYKGCPKFSNCLPVAEGGNCTDENCCSPDKPICFGAGTCAECAAVPDPVTGKPPRQHCEELKGREFCDINQSGLGCICRNGKCAQCKAINEEDPEFCRRDTNPYCVGGLCVECRNDRDCIKAPGDERTFCYKNTCQDQCHNGKDDDNDGVLDEQDADCLFGSGSEFPQCSNVLDDDDDGKADFPADPGCISAEDPSEEDPLTQCSDILDNADPEDLLADLADPGCDSPQDDDETNAPVGPPLPPGPRR